MKNKLLPSLPSKIKITRTKYSIDKSDLDTNNNKELTISLINMYEALFTPIPDKILLTLQEKQYRITLYKTFLYLKSDPYHNIMLHKKVTNVLLDKDYTKTQKIEAFNYFMKWYKGEALKYNIPVDENTNFTVLYEMYTAVTFGDKQPSVHSITILAENVTRNIEAQQASMLLTKQKNCDLSVVYGTNNNKVSSLLDIKIGNPRTYKGNLIFTKPYDTSAMNNQKNHMLSELDTYSKNHSLKEEDQQLIKNKIILIKELANSGMTLQAQTLVMQEEVISLISTIRKVVPNYNPNMIAFIPENPKTTVNVELLATKLQSYVPYDFSIATSNNQTESIIRKTLPIYLDYKKPDLSVMAPKERELCISILKKFAPEYLIKL